MSEICVYIKAVLSIPYRDFISRNENVAHEKVNRKKSYEYFSGIFGEINGISEVVLVELLVQRIQIIF